MLLNANKGGILDDRESLIDLWPFPIWRRCTGSDDEGKILHNGRSYIFIGDKSPILILLIVKLSPYPLIDNLFTISSPFL